MRAGVQGRLDPRVVAVRGEHHDLRRRHHVAQLRHDLGREHVGEAQVEEDEVGRELRGALDRRAPALRRPDDDERGLRAQQESHAVPHDRVVVDHHDPRDRHRVLR